MNSDEDNPLIKKISIDTIKKRDLLVARPYFEFNQSKNIVSLEDLINKGVITTFDGHGSPAGYLKGLGENPYVRVKDIVNLEIAHNRLDDIPDKEYDRLYKKWQIL